MSKLVVSSGIASEADEFYVKWARESVKATTPLLNDVLGKVLALASVLVGGGMALLDKAVMPQTCKVGMLAAFAITAAACLAGLCPTGRRVWTDPDDIRAFEAETITRKKQWLQAAAVLLMIGFTVGIVGVAIGGATTETPAKTLPAPN